MKNHFTKYLAIAAMAFFLCGKVMAGGTVSIGYSHYDLDLGGEAGTVYGSFGYEIPLASAFSFTPEARVGFGVRDTGFRSVAIDSLYGLAGRFTFYTQSGLHFFGSASYIKYELSGFGVSGTTWEPGFGAGLGFDFTEHTGMEVLYENVDSTNVLSLAFRFRF